MRANIDYLSTRFREFNEKYFGGRLKPLPIRLSNGRSFVGEVQHRKRLRPEGGFYYDNFVLIMSVRFDLEESVLEDVLLHEMIHYEILSNQMQDSAPHGVLFRQKMKELNERYGRHITIRHRLQENELQPRHGKQFLMCVSTFADGQVGVTVVAKTKLFVLWDRLPLIPGVQRCDWFASTDPFFERYPKAQTLRIYKATAAELEAHLKDARVMVRQGDTIYLRRRTE